MSAHSASAKITRRDFLAETSAAGAVLLAAPHLAATAPRGANDRLSIGMIGVGDRASAHVKQLQGLAKECNVEITAVCDVWKMNLDKAAAAVKKSWGKEPRKCTRFGDLLSLKDIDGVVIATPDFAHGPILVAALQAGKDVYVEKPMSIDLDLANQALDLARANGRVVQAGTQHRSEGPYLAAAKVVASGVLGQISRATVEVAFNEPRWARPYDNCREGDVDWSAYLLDRPKLPFDPKLLRRWHLYKLCTNGLSGLWMSHYSDAVHLILAAKYPASAVAHGGTYVWKDGRQHTDTFHALLDYPEGFLMSWGMGLGNSAGGRFTVHGTQGTLDVDKATLSPIGGAKGTKIKEQEVEPEKTISHMGNWLECMRTRQRPNADIQYGHQHAAATILAAAALETGMRQKYDPAKRQITAG
jgi:predicted dehydrogenase